MPELAAAAQRVDRRGRQVQPVGHLSCPALTDADGPPVTSKDGGSSPLHPASEEAGAARVVELPSVPASPSRLRHTRGWHHGHVLWVLARADPYWHQARLVRVHAARCERLSLCSTPASSSTASWSCPIFHVTRGKVETAAGPNLTCSASRTSAGMPSCLCSRRIRSRVSHRFRITVPTPCRRRRGSPNPERRLGRAASGERARSTPAAPAHVIVLYRGPCATACCNLRCAPPLSTRGCRCPGGLGRDPVPTGSRPKDGFRASACPAPSRT